MKKMEVLFYLKLLRPVRGVKREVLPCVFVWSAWAYLSEMNDVARAQLLRDAEASNLIYRIGFAGVRGRSFRKTKPQKEQKNERSGNVGRNQCGKNHSKS